MPRIESPSAQDLLSIGAVPFQANALSAPSCSYFNPMMISRAEALGEFAYAVPSEHENDECYTNRTASFLADRYGGKGIGLNGGAARSGTRGRYQIKGIGRTPLVGLRAAEQDFWHSHGGISLPDAIRETIWGEVYALALPYGAIRIAAIISTGSLCWFELTGGVRGVARRALLVREIGVRPAHFIRASFFVADPTLQLESDVIRVRRSVAAILTLLPKSRGVVDMSPEQLLAAGLQEMAKRMAFQCAASQSKRLLHGAINEGNICVDGRWIDYGTATALPTYANLKCYGAPRSFATLWEEHLRIPLIIGRLCFFINKYSPHIKVGSHVSAEALVENYFDFYESALTRSFVRLVGIPDMILSKMWSYDHTTRLGRTIAKIVQRQNSHRIEPASSDLSIFKSTPLAEIYMILANRVDLHEQDLCLQSTVPNCADRLQLIQAYSQFRQSASVFAREMGVAETAIQNMCVLGAFKIDKSIEELDRVRMAEDNERISSIQDEAELKQAIDSKIERICDEAQILVGYEDGLSALAWKRGKNRLVYVAQTGQWRSEIGNTVLDTSIVFRESPFSENARAFYGEKVRWLN